MLLCRSSKGQSRVSDPFRSSTSPWCLAEDTLIGSFADTRSATTSSDPIAVSDFAHRMVPRTARSRLVCLEYEGSMSLEV